MPMVYALYDMSDCYIKIMSQDEFDLHIEEYRKTLKGWVEEEVVDEMSSEEVIEAYWGDEMVLAYRHIQ